MKSLFFLRLLSHVILLIYITISFTTSSAKFDDQFQSSWALDHIIKENDTVKMKLDSSSGAGIASKSKYLYGKTTAEMKLVPGDSAGTVTAFYMSSDGETHNEFDFEFLGNTTGEPYLVQTNVYVNGVGNREQRMDLWFDATRDFHNYSILWNPKKVVFTVDDTPIRVYENREGEGLAFPKDQPMGVYSSIWNADDWATQGGRVKTDWSHQPFVTEFREVRMEGCEVVEGKEVEGEVKRCGESWEGKEGRYWWKEKEMEELSVHQSHQLVWVRANHLVYDYCFDSARFPAMPPECKR